MKDTSKQSFHRALDMLNSVLMTHKRVTNQVKAAWDVLDLYIRNIQFPKTFFVCQRLKDRYWLVLENLGLWIVYRRKDEELTVFQWKISNWRNFPNDVFVELGCIPYEIAIKAIELLPLLLNKAYFDLDRINKRYHEYLPALEKLATLVEQTSHYSKVSGELDNDT